MQYRTNIKNGDKVSALAFGCMRFGKDDAATERQILTAIEGGVNYFDTAYVYPRSEERLGRILANNKRRNAVLLADKLPPYLVKKNGDADKILATQLQRLQAEHIDYYLIHMLAGSTEWERLRALALPEWLARQKEKGVLRNIGFSFHGGLPEFLPLLQATDWDFCMLQYNYYDENQQAGRAGVEAAAAQGLPLMIMEPLRGGKLATGLPPPAKAVWDHAFPRRSPAEWALRWVWQHEEVLTVLSGMNSEEMVRENARVAADALPGSLSPEELALFTEARRLIAAGTKVPCTGCNYCMPCPYAVDIPLCFSTYNDLALQNRFLTLFAYIFRAQSHQASLCRRCGQCLKHCPQRIDIPERLKEVAREMEKFPYKPARALIRRFMRLR
ncbi:MAG: aldo/keto reductase [Gracilibacteraceae bacterium]|jgi:predicted aldo/keto reductase-like oxidoreductase|nr:aldo/keto reductase [Gracilibacteraceae bacterium]